MKKNKLTNKTTTFFLIGFPLQPLFSGKTLVYFHSSQLHPFRCHCPPTWALKPHSKTMESPDWAQVLLLGPPSKAGYPYTAVQLISQNNSEDPVPDLKVHVMA